MTTTRGFVQHHDTSPSTTPDEHSHHQQNDLHNDHEHDHHDDHQHDQNQNPETTNDTDTNDHDTKNYEDPQAEHTSASRSSGDLREPWRARSMVSPKIHTEGLVSIFATVGGRSC